jgi:hypothetical protein
MPMRNGCRIMDASRKEVPMNTRAPFAWAWVVAFGALLLVIDLFFDWFKTAVDVAGVVTVQTTSSGWGYSWGILAGILALAVIVFVLTRHAVWTLVCSFAMLIATGIAVFFGDASVTITAAGVSVDTTQWAAWLGFGFAALTAAAALVPFLKALSAAPHRLEPHRTT